MGDRYYHSTLILRTQVSTKKIAFTLSEVLITLGIIGVVAALTLPNLIANYKKQTYVEGLKVAFSTMSQALKMAMVEEGVEDFNQTSLFDDCGGNISGDLWSQDEEGNRTSNYDLDRCTQALSKYVKQIRLINDSSGVKSAKKHGYISITSNCPKEIIGHEAWYSLNNSNRCTYVGANTSFILMNSMTVIFDAYNNGLTRGDIYVDINGTKAPNTYGRDFYNLVILKNGTLTTPGSRLHSDTVNIPGWYWKNRENVYGCSKTTTATGSGCGTRIMEENWKMNY